MGTRECFLMKSVGDFFFGTRAGWVRGSVTFVTKMSFLELPLEIQEKCPWTPSFDNKKKQLIKSRELIIFPTQRHPNIEICGVIFALLLI